MPDDSSAPPLPEAMTAEQVRRWDEVLDRIRVLLPAGAARVLVEGADSRRAAAVADRLAAAVRGAGRPCVRPAALETTAPKTTAPETTTAARPGETVLLAHSSGRPADRTSTAWDLVVELRTRTGRDDDPDRPADVVVDLHDPAWPVIRRVAERLAADDGWHVTESRAFFAVRAATWDTRFGDDTPAYTAAVAELGLPTGATILDVGCGTGRALPVLRAAVGPAGTVLGLDVTPEMLAVAREHGRAGHADLLLGDARRLPVRTGAVDAVFAAGLVTHLPDLPAGLAELARVSRPGGRLAIFHPSGRAALAARHGRVLRPDEPLAADRLGPLLAGSGWRLDGYDDPPHRFLALASRR
ncbi:methyltransferase domain-containing protein [Parafrankia sp. FMc6]|uniref:class I SAM-dependent methyltransferase n=1 Tax=Parafrankia soli TaxID=2599596 RepID=UPI0034D5115B